MLISVCVFGYGEAGRKFVDIFKSLPDYGVKYRIHMVQVSSLQALMPEVLLNAKGQWKLHDKFFEDTEMGISFGDDLEWLRESGWEGHDVVVDCSDSEDYFAEEIQYQLDKHQRMRFFDATDLKKVDVVIDELKKLIDSRNKGSR